MDQKELDQSSEIDAILKVRQLFQFPQEIEVIAEGFKNLSTGYTSALDGEISYITDGNFSIASELFPHLTTGPVGENDVREAQGDIDEKLQQINILENTITTAGLSSDATVKLYMDALREYRDKFEMIRDALWIEAEKGGYPLSPKKRDSVLPRIMEKHREIWGDLLNSHPEEVRGAYKEFRRIYQQQGDVLTATEKTVYENFLHDVEEQHELGLIHSFEEKITGAIPGSLLDRHMHAEDQRDIFLALKKMSYDLYLHQGVMGEEWDIITNPLSANMSVDQLHKLIKMPGKGSRPLGDIAKKFGHEFDEHTISGMNTNMMLGHGFKGRKYLGTEEGCATLREYITDGTIRTRLDLDALQIDQNEKTRALLVCEMYDADTATDILGLYKKMGGYDPMSPGARVKRTKRFVPWYMPGVSTKDTVYLRGLHEVIYTLQQARSTEEMLSLLTTLGQFKIHYRDLPMIEQIKKDYGLENTMLYRNTFVARALYRLLAGEKTIQAGTIDEYIYKQNDNYRKVEYDMNKLYADLVR